jgi:hypothetical protein
VIKPETVQVSNKGGIFVFCPLQEQGEDGGFYLLSRRFLELFGPLNDHYIKVATGLIDYIRTQLEIKNYYVLRLGTDNLTFFKVINQNQVFENAPLIAQQIFEKKIDYGFNREFEIHLRILSYRK